LGDHWVTRPYPKTEKKWVDRSARGGKNIILIKVFGFGCFDGKFDYFNILTGKYGSKYEFKYGSKYEFKYGFKIHI